MIEEFQDPFRGKRMRRNFPESLSLGHAPRPGPEVRNRSDNKKGLSLKIKKRSRLIATDQWTAEQNHWLWTIEGNQKIGFLKELFRFRHFGLPKRRGMGYTITLSQRDTDVEIACIRCCIAQPGKASFPTLDFSNLRR